MTQQADMRRDWEQPFLEAVSEGETLNQAARMAGIHRSTPSSRARAHPAFAARFEAARAEGKRARETQEPALRNTQWRKHFLEALAETSNVSAAAARAGVPPQTAYKTKREDPEFAARWLAALHEGYDHLEMELLGHLRDPAPSRKMDVTAALRLLAAHRETVERQRTVVGAEQNGRAMRDSLLTYIREMRERRFANEALLIEAKADDGAA